MESLFEPIVLGSSGRTARNRVALAALTNKQSKPDGTLGDAERRWLEVRARGGFGVVTTCATYVSPEGKGWAGELRAHDDRTVPGLRRLAESLHDQGALGLVQLFHGGARADPEVTRVETLSASAIPPAPEAVTPRAMTAGDISRVVDDFAKAARRCEAAGWDGVELHGAHGYLISQFLGRRSNVRDDEYGGSLENRARFLREILRAVRTLTSAPFAVGVRLSPELRGMGIELDETLELVRELGPCFDFVHMSLWDAFAPPRSRPGLEKPMTTLFREALTSRVPLVVAGSIWSADDARRALDQGADVVALGRAGILNPDWVKLVREGREPARPPMSRASLIERGASERFVDYLSVRWAELIEG